MSSPAIEICDVHKSYKMGREKLHVLRGVSLRLARGEFAAIVGASGSGKSTLLHIGGLLDTQDAGHVYLNGLDAAGFSNRKRNAMRCGDVGFVFQFYHLFGELNVLENTMLPAQVDSSVFGWLKRSRRDRKHATELLERMGLGERMKHKPSELSGGERQRVAIARALMNKPDILLADEPTGNLDSKTGKKIMKLLGDLNKAGQTILMVTHDASIAAVAHKTLHLADGRMV